MATEKYLVTALPYSASPDDPFHVSFFVTHRLTPDGAAGVVDDFTTVRDWTARLADARFTLRAEGHAGGVRNIPIEPLLEPLDATLWPRVFPGSLAVRPWQVPNHTSAPWNSFPAHRMQQHALLAHALSLYSSPVSAPSVMGNALTEQVLDVLGVSMREGSLTDVIDGVHDRRISAGLDDLVAHGGIRAAAGMAGNSPLLQLVADVHRARRFYQREEDASEYHPRPVEGAVGEPVAKPVPDFHARASMLGDLSPLLRKLGLVIDVRVTSLAYLAGIQWIQGQITLPGLTTRQTAQPRVRCRVLRQTFTAVSSSGDYDLGMLRIGEEERFTVLDLDPDASALKLEQLVRNLPRLAAAERNGDPVTSAPSTLRATGFAVARHDRAAELHERMDNAARKDAALLAGTAPPISLEQINRGMRLEVWDDVSGTWRSLHQRLLTVTVDGVGTVLSGEPDVGFVQSAALTTSDRVPNGPRYAHEVVAGWDGWSLSAPRPGKVVVHEDGEELLLDAPEPDPDPVNPVVTTTEAAPGTLPRLRYGRSYALRAYAVDLAGNSRPHAVGNVPPAESPAPRPVSPPDQPPTSGGQQPAPRVPAPTTPRLATAIEISGVVASEQILARRASAVADATRTVSSRDSSNASAGRDASSLLRDRLGALRTAQGIGPQPDRGVPGIDPEQLAHVAGIDPTSLPALHQLIAERTNARASLLGAASRSAQIEQTFIGLSSTAPVLMERTDFQTSPQTAGAALRSMLAQQPGLGAAAVNGGDAPVQAVLSILSDTVTTPRPFLRWDPIIEPATVPRHPYTEGESLLRLVIRSGVEQAAPGDLGLTVTPPASYAAETLAAHPGLELAWREDSQRHLAAPKTSQLDAELHGAFDSALGAARPAAAVRAAYAVALREAGSFMDATVADLANPGQRVAQPGVVFHTTPTSDPPEVAAPEDLPDGDALSPGQYVAHDVDALVLPYLPDPLAVGLSFAFPDAGRDHRLSGLLAMEGITLRYRGTWPERTPFRLVLESGPQLGAVVDEHVIRITLPPGEQLRMRMSSSLAKPSLDLLGLWRSLPAVLRTSPLLSEAAADGWFWWLTPSTELRLVHAVPRPVEVPRFTLLHPNRAVGDTAVVLGGAVDVHGPSTERLDIEAEWSQWVDDITKPAPERIRGVAAVCTTSITPDEDLVLLSVTDETITLPGGAVLRTHAAVHQTGDTKHRMIDYRVRATTRYREYFLPQVTPDIDALSVVGPVRTINVPSSARPPKIIVRDVLPLFRWSEETEPSQPFGLRRTRRAGVRIYLERPWYATGDGELVGVLLSIGSDALVRGSVSQWGGDPVFRQQGPARRHALPLTDLLQRVGLNDRVEAGRPVGPAAAHTVADVAGAPTVYVLGYQPEYSEERALWFVDVAMDPGSAFWPFVQFAVARFQPNSLPGLHLGPVTLCDFVQLAPERIATLGRTDEQHVRVVVTGAVGHPAIFVDGLMREPSFLDQVAGSRTMRARLERFDPTVGTDLAWAAVSQQDLPIRGVDGTVVSWSGEIALPEAVPPRTPGTNERWRVTVEEWEWLQADSGAGGHGGLQPRIVYADHLPL